jgi:hypothetical protein
MAVLAPAPLSIDDFSRLPRNGERHEMSAGDLITTPPAKSLHSLIASAVVEVLQTYLNSGVLDERSPKLVMFSFAIL